MEDEEKLIDHCKQEFFLTMHVTIKSSSNFQDPMKLKARKPNYKFRAFARHEKFYSFFMLISDKEKRFENSGNHAQYSKQ